MPLSTSTYPPDCVIFSPVGSLSPSCCQRDASPASCTFKPKSIWLVSTRFAMQFCQLGFHLIITQTERRTSAPVDSIELVFLGAVNDCEQIAANAVGDRRSEEHTSELQSRND